MVLLSHVIRALALLVFVASAHAETIPATIVETVANYGPAYAYMNGVKYNSASAMCGSSYASATFAFGRPAAGTTDNGLQWVCGWREPDGSTAYNGASYYTKAYYCTTGTLENQLCKSNTCPVGKNWTLSGTSCTRPDCVAPQVRNSSNGLCEAPPDPCASRTGSTLDWYVSPVGQPSLESSNYCDNGCAVGMNAAPSGSSYTNGKLRVQQYSKVQLSYTCTPGLTSAPGGVAPEVKPPEPPKNPPCAPSEGVLTSTSGTIACVPSGTPASAPPIVDKKKTTEAYPDGSQKITETTTTRDPQTGVEDKRTTTTNTPASGGSAGQAGTPGTSTSATTGGTAPNAASGTGKEGDTSNDLCQKNPNLQICKGDMNKEETQKKLEEHLKAIKDGMDPGTTSYDAVKNAKPSDDSEQALQEQSDKLTAATTGAFDPVTAQKSSWQTAMSSGWFEPVPNSSCAPIVWNFSGHSATFDICQPAQKLSEMLEYAMWFLIVVGTFVMFTGGQVRSS